MVNHAPTDRDVITELTDYAHKLRRAYDNLADIGTPMISQSPRHLVYEKDLVKLYRYDPPKPLRRRKKIPLLLVFALVNRPYILDLDPNRSLIGALLRRGHDVYLIDWGNPGPEHTDFSLGNYITDFYRQCVDFILYSHGIDRLNILGVCQGGVFSLAFTALFPQTVNRLITMVTPVDFHVPDFLLSKLLQGIDMELLIDTYGNIPGQLVNAVFLSLKPYALTSRKYFDLLEQADSREQLLFFLKMEKWVNDNPDQAGKACDQFVTDLFLRNHLVKNELYIDDQHIDLSRIRLPVLNIFADRDHIVPPSASRALSTQIKKCFYSEYNFDGGHIGIYVSTKAQRVIPDTINLWLSGRKKFRPG